MQHERDLGFDNSLRFQNKFVWLQRLKRIVNLKVNSKPVLTGEKEKENIRRRRREVLSKRKTIFFFFPKKAFKELQNNIKILFPQFYPSPKKGELVIFHCKV